MKYVYCSIDKQCIKRGIKVMKVSLICCCLVMWLYISGWRDQVYLMNEAVNRSLIHSKNRNQTRKRKVLSSHVTDGHVMSKDTLTNLREDNYLLLTNNAFARVNLETEMR